MLEYADNARLYLPVVNIELLSKYGHDEGLLDRLGGGAWQAKKARLKERIRDMADRLIRVAAERALRKAPVLDPPPGMWDAFSARFPYQETDDQLRAIGDVVQDLTSGQPMDRLICGDVGFGKNRGCDARRVCCGHVGGSGGGGGTDHIAVASTCQKLCGAVPRISDPSATAVTFCAGQRGTGHPRRNYKWDGRYCYWHPRPAGKINSVSEPRPFDHR